MVNFQITDKKHVPKKESKDPTVKTGIPPKQTPVRKDKNDTEEKTFVIKAVDIFYRYVIEPLYDIIIGFLYLSKAVLIQSGKFLSAFFSGLFDEEYKFQSNILYSLGWGMGSMICLVAKVSYWCTIGLLVAILVPDIGKTIVKAEIFAEAIKDHLEDD